MNRLCYSLFGRLHATLASVRGNKGQTFTEYAIIVATIIVGVVAAVGGLRDAVITAITTVAADI